MEPIRILISYELRDQLEKEWWADYSQCAYPFFMWALMKHNAKLVRDGNNIPFQFEFITKNHADSFMSKYNLSE